MAPKTIYIVAIVLAVVAVAGAAVFIANNGSESGVDGFDKPDV